MKYRSNRLQGNISLTTVLVTSAILLLSGTTLLFGSIDQGRVSKDNVNYELAQIRSYSCLEEAMNKIKRNQAFVDIAEISYEDGHCQAEVSIDPVNNNIRMINIISIYNNYQISNGKKVDISTSPYTITNQ